MFYNEKLVMNVLITTWDCYITSTLSYNNTDYSIPLVTGITARHYQL